MSPWKDAKKFTLRNVKFNSNAVTTHISALKITNAARGSKCTRPLDAFEIQRPPTRLSYENYTVCFPRHRKFFSTKISPAAESYFQLPRASPAPLHPPRMKNSKRTARKKKRRNRGGRQAGRQHLERALKARRCYCCRTAHTRAYCNARHVPAAAAAAELHVYVDSQRRVCTRERETSDRQYRRTLANSGLT